MQASMQDDGPAAKPVAQLGIGGNDMHLIREDPAVEPSVSAAGSQRYPARESHLQSQGRHGGNVVEQVGAQVENGMRYGYTAISLDSNTVGLDFCLSHAERRQQGEQKC